MRFSPRVHEFLVGRTWAHDDGRLAIAEIWRRVRRDAEHVGLFAPGYHTIRTIVRAERERRAAQREALVIAVEEAFRWAPDPLRILDHLAAAARLHRWPGPRTMLTVAGLAQMMFGDGKPP
jgi:hypothetical protein